MVSSPFQSNSAISADDFAKVGRQVTWERKFAVLGQDLDHCRGGHAGGGRIPQRQVGEAIRVNMLGAFFQFRERGQGVASGGIARIVNFDENRAVALNDEWIGYVVIHYVTIVYVNFSNRQKNRKMFSLVV